EPEPVLSALGQTLAEAGVEAGGITVLTPAGGDGFGPHALPPGATRGVHDPAGRGPLGYVASTKHGRRVYLNRHLTDADVVVPVGRLGFDPVLGHRGPWSVLFPELSDSETMQAYREVAPSEEVQPTPSRAKSRLEESLEVS